MTTDLKTLAEGRSWKSEQKIFGLPWISIVYGEAGEASGPIPAVLALGDKPLGIVAVGFMARGVLAIGNISLGVFAFGPLSIGVLTAFGGAALGGGLAFGGLAAGFVAVGGLAIGGLAMGGLAMGYYALGGLAVGLHTLSPAGIQPQVVSEFLRWLQGLTR